MIVDYWLSSYGKRGGEWRSASGLDGWTRITANCPWIKEKYIYPQMSQMDTDGGPQADGGGEQVLIDDWLFTHNIFSAVFIKLRKFLIKDYFRHGWTRLFIKKTRFGGGMGMAYIVLSYTKYRHSSTIPPKYFGFAEVLHARQCSNAFVIALA